LSPDAFARLKICQKCVCDRSSAPNPTEGAYSVPSGPLIGFESRFAAGGLKAKRKKWEGKEWKWTEKEKREREGKGMKWTGRKRRRQGRGRAPETTYSW